MGEFKLLNVGVVNGDGMDKYYRVMMETEGQSYSLELNFQQNTIEESKRAALKNFVEHLELYEATNKKVLQENFLKSEKVQEYIDFNCDKFGHKVLAQELGLDLNAGDFKGQLLQQLKLIRVGLYPDGVYDDSYYATFDYVLNEKLPCQTLAIKTDEQGVCKFLSWE